jgi:cytidylate kinase
MNTRVITISRQVGTDGEEVARLVAEQLGLRLLDYRVVQEAAQEAGVSPETVSEAEHKPSFLTRMMEALARSSAPAAGTGWTEPVNIAGTPLLTSSDYRKLVEDVVRDFANQGEVLFLGHGAQFMLHERTDTFKVLICGSELPRARRVMSGMNVDEATARKTVLRTDQERMDFFKTYYHADWLSASAYDLSLNTDHLTPKQAADLIVAAVRMH